MKRSRCRWCEFSMRPVSDVAAILGVTESDVRRWCKLGVIDKKRVGRVDYVLMPSVRRFLNQVAASHSKS